MKVTAGITSCCVVLLLTLTSVSAVRRVLNSINDLHFVPRECLVLLRWFANTVDIDRNNDIHLNFDPNSDYTSHHYGNYERVLNPPPRGFRYYTIGNINIQTSRQLPPHVQNQLGEGNRARIIISVSNQRAPRVDRVYITQHHQTFGMSEYDPEQTYEVTANLLRGIRESPRERHGTQFYDCVSFLCRLLLFLVVAFLCLAFLLSAANKK